MAASSNPLVGYGAMYSGIFTGKDAEVPIMVANIMLGYVNQRLREWAEIARGNRDKFLKGLRGVPYWSDVTKRQETERLTASRPGLYKMYRYTAVRYASELYVDENAGFSIEISVPALDEFVHGMIRDVVDSELMRSGQYEHLVDMRQRELMCNTMRNVLYDILFVKDNVRRVKVEVSESAIREAMEDTDTADIDTDPRQPDHLPRAAPAPWAPPPVPEPEPAPTLQHLLEPEQPYHEQSHHEDGEHELDKPDKPDKPDEPDDQHGQDATPGTELTGGDLTRGDLQALSGPPPPGLAEGLSTPTPGERPSASPPLWPSLGSSPPRLMSVGPRAATEPASETLGTPRDLFGGYTPPPIESVPSTRHSPPAMDSVSQYHHRARDAPPRARATSPENEDATQRLSERMLRGLRNTVGPTDPVAHWRPPEQPVQPNVQSVAQPVDRPRSPEQLNLERAIASLRSHISSLPPRRSPSPEAEGTQPGARAVAGTYSHAEAAHLDRDRNSEAGRTGSPLF